MVFYGVATLNVDSYATYVDGSYACNAGTFLLPMDASFSVFNPAWGIRVILSAGNLTEEEIWVSLNP